MSSLDERPSWWNDDKKKRTPKKMAAADEKHSRDPSFKRGASSLAAAVKGPLNAFIRGGRSSALAASLEARKMPPPGSAKNWLSDPANLAWATKRRMVSKIANKANPSSKDSADVFTINGKRYALTDLYRSPIRERLGDVRAKTKARGLDWWDANGKKVVVGTVALVGLYVVYTTLKNKQLESQLQRGGPARGPLRTLPRGPLGLRPLTTAPVAPIHHASGGYRASGYDYPGSTNREGMPVDPSFEDFDAPGYYPFEYSWQ
jgi:hypothetical protein